MSGLTANSSLLTARSPQAAGVLDGVGAVLEAAGFSRGAVRAARLVMERDGMATTTEACRVLGIDRQTLRRRCRALGVRRVARTGRQGSLVDLAALAEVEGAG